MKQTTHRAVEFVARGAAITPLFNSCSARIVTDGSAVLLGFRRQPYTMRFPKNAIMT